MRKYVYLFELDCVRKTDADIIAGQKALYAETFKMMQNLLMNVWQDMV